MRRQTIMLWHYWIVVVVLSLLHSISFLYSPECASNTFIFSALVNGKATASLVEPAAHIERSKRDEQQPQQNILSQIFFGSNQNRAGITKDEISITNHGDGGTFVQVRLRNDSPLRNDRTSIMEQLDKVSGLSDLAKKNIAKFIAGESLENDKGEIVDVSNIVTGRPLFEDKGEIQTSVLSHKQLLQYREPLQQPKQGLSKVAKAGRKGSSPRASLKNEYRIDVPTTESSTDDVGETKAVENALSKKVQQKKHSLDTSDYDTNTNEDFKEVQDKSINSHDNFLFNVLNKANRINPSNTNDDVNGETSDYYNITAIGDSNVSAGSSSTTDTGDSGHNINKIGDFNSASTNVVDNKGNDNHFVSRDVDNSKFSTNGGDHSVTTSNNSTNSKNVGSNARSINENTSSSFKVSKSSMKSGNERSQCSNSDDVNTSKFVSTTIIKTDSTGVDSSVKSHDRKIVLKITQPDTNIITNNQPHQQQQKKVTIKSGESGDYFVIVPDGRGGGDRKRVNLKISVKGHGGENTVLSQSTAASEAATLQMRALNDQQASKKDMYNSVANNMTPEEALRFRKREESILIDFFRQIRASSASLQRDGKIFHSDYCMWRGVTCGKASVVTTFEKNFVPPFAVTGLAFPFAEIVSSTIPSSLFDFKYLDTLNLANNRISGNLARLFDSKRSTSFAFLRFFDVSHNELTGEIPSNFLSSSTKLQDLRLSSNALNGTLDNFFSLTSNSTFGARTSLRLFDISDNIISGSIPLAIKQLSSLEYFLVAENVLEGSLPKHLRTLSQLKLFHAEHNALNSSLKAVISALPRASLTDIDLSKNFLHGRIPLNLLQLTKLETLIVSRNDLSGSIPLGNEAKNITWRNMKELAVIWLNNNMLSGTIPTSFFSGLQHSLMNLDISNNLINGTIPETIGLMSKLYNIEAMNNNIRGTLPNSMMKLNKNLRLNFTNNLLTGTIPSLFCGEGASSMSMLYQEFRCDAVLCRPGTFNVHGHATLHSACRLCPKTEESEASDPPKSKILGRISCDGVDFIHGDLNGDGVLSAREILRMLYIDTLGRFWGLEYHTWADMNVNECRLEGVTCHNGEVVNIDLSSANMCSDGNRRPGPIRYCKGIPAEIGELKSLEVLIFSRRQFLRGSIPTEIGRLTKLRMLDISSCVSMTGTLPYELGRLTNLKTLKVVHTRIQGLIPTDLFALSSLESMHLTNNQLTGTIPPTKMENLKELMIARNKLTGPLPTEIGLLTKIENFEAYHNLLTGQIPDSIGSCALLKRIDIFHNFLTATIPNSILDIEVLQILHLKDNRLTGTIPEIGHLPYLTWVDLSNNLLHGTIPQSLGNSRSIEDLRVMGNMIYEPIPQGLCTNPNVNGGAAKVHGCDGVICPLGSYSEFGHATLESGCTKCPQGESTLYLGALRHTCRVFSPEDIMSIFYDVMGGEIWPDELQENWRNPEVHLCDWAGLTCDENGEIQGVSVPLIGLEEY